jgi:hypothetical protein
MRAEAVSMSSFDPENVEKFHCNTVHFRRYFFAETRLRFAGEGRAAPSPVSGTLAKQTPTL